MEEIDLKELFQMFWENKLKMIIITLIFLVMGIVYTLYFVTPKYESATKLLLATNSKSSGTVTNELAVDNTSKNKKSNTIDNIPSTIIETQETITTTDLTINSKLVSTYSELIKSNKIIRKVISNLELDVEEDYIRDNVTVESVSDTELIEISVKNVDPELAAKIANEMSEVFIETINEFYGIDNVHIVDTAETSSIPCNINHIKDVLIFVCVGVVLACGYVLLLSMFDTRLKSPEEIESKLGIPVIANLPQCNFKNRSEKGGKHNEG